MKKPLDYAKSLLLLADRDVNAFHALKDDHKWNIDPSIICFHAQQAVEKSLKAILASRNLEFGRTHDLSKLAYEVTKIPLSLPISIIDLSKLNPYAVTVRYDEQEINILTVREAESIMDKIKTWAAKMIYIDPVDET